jgi:hypothetical protein
MAAHLYGVVDLINFKEYEVNGSSIKVVCHIVDIPDVKSLR